MKNESLSYVTIIFTLIACARKGVRLSSPPRIMCLSVALAANSAAAAAATSTPTAQFAVGALLAPNSQFAVVPYTPRRLGPLFKHVSMFIQ